MIIHSIYNMSVSPTLPVRRRPQVPSGPGEMLQLQLEIQAEVPGIVNILDWCQCQPAMSPILEGTICFHLST